MAIDIGRGFKRLFLVILILWSSFFFYASYANLESEVITEQISGFSCDEPISINTIKLYKKLYGEDNVEFTNGASGNTCFAGIKLEKFEDRITDDSIVYFWLALISVPIYFLLVFIINGFYRK